MTTGQRLKSARDAQGITLQDVARRTNIRPRFLQAIEEDDLATIPSSHRRLFVREFAKIVGVDPNEVLAELPEVSPVVIAPEALTRETPAYRSEPDEGDRREYRAILDRLSSSGGRMTALTRNPAFMLIGAATVLLLAVAVYTFVLGDDAATAQTSVAAADTSASSTEILSAPESEGAPTATPAIELEPGDSLTLEGRATARVWYTIVMDGKRSETGTLDSGLSKTWRASEVFKVSLGNAGGLSLHLNERAIGTLGPAQSVVRSKLIDKDGIRVGSAPRRTASAASSSGTVATTDDKPAARRVRSASTRRSTSRATTRTQEPMKEILTTQIR